MSKKSLNFEQIKEMCDYARNHSKIEDCAEILFKEIKKRAIEPYSRNFEDIIYICNLYLGTIK